MTVRVGVDEGGSGAVDVAVVVRGKPDGLEGGQEAGSEPGAEALGEPVEAHDDALHGARRIDVG